MKAQSRIHLPHGRFSLPRCPTFERSLGRRTCRQSASSARAAIAYPKDVVESATTRSSRGSTLRYSESYTPEAWPSASLPLEEACVPPASWYYDPEFYRLEQQRTFGKYWQYVGAASRLRNPGDYFTGFLNRQGFVVVKTEDGSLRAYHNVCSHRAAAVAAGEGCLAEGRFQCPYHGWQFDLEGRFRGCAVAHGLQGIRDFAPDKSGLVPIRVDTWGSLIFLNMSNTPDLPSVSAFIGQAAEADMVAEGLKDDDWVFYRRLEYPMKCNWKIMADNYQDGNYHVYLCHPGLIKALDMDVSVNRLYDHVSVMWGPNRGHLANEDPTHQHIISSRTRGGADQSYTMLYPNLFFNRYGSWMSTTTVYPVSPEECLTVFDCFFKDADLCPENQAWLDECMRAENELQVEDVGLCLRVAENLHDPLYQAGRYAPIESPMWWYHQRLHEDIFGTAPGLVHRPQQDKITRAYWKEAQQASLR